jgi:hypothetical protein
MNSQANQYNKTFLCYNTMYHKFNEAHRKGTNNAQQARDRDQIHQWEALHIL